MITVAELAIYPIKSTGGATLPAAELLTTGLRHDRGRALVNAATNRIITARDYPALFGLSTTVVDDQLVVYAGDAFIALPLVPEDGAQVAVDLWASEGHPGLRYSSEVDRWFSDYLGLDCYLIAMGPDCRRPLPTNLPTAYIGEPDDAVSYADDYPVLLASEASLVDLNTRLAAPVTMRRFRPNIVLQGATAFEEDTWLRIRVGECELEFAQQCPRCVMTTIDPATQARSATQEPLRTLAAYRKSPGGAPFGVQLVPRRQGRIAVGDPVEVLAYRPGA